MITLIEDMNVLALMATQVEYISPSQTVFDALLRMSREEMPELLIGTPKRLQGIITSHDFSSQRKIRLPEDLHTPLSERFLGPVHTIDHTATAETARNQMRELGIGCLPVMQGGEAIGIIRTLDIMNKFYAQIELARDTYALSLEQMTEGVCVVNAEGAILALSRTAETDFESPQNDEPSRDREFFPLALLNRAMRSREAIEDVIHCPRQGKILEVSAIPLYTKGRLIGAIATNRDVTNQMEMAHDLQDARNRLHLLQNEINHYSAEVYQLSSIIGTSPFILSMKHTAEQVALTDQSIIVTGPSGSGKEFLARAIHHTSNSKGAFVPINCGVLSDSVMDADRMGYTARSFVRFLNRCQDEVFELGQEGTVFLDNLSHLAPAYQAKLLHILKYHPEEIRWRFIGASTENMHVAIKDERFDGELYQMLAKNEWTIPPLKDRPEDTECYLNYFFKEHCRSYNKPVFPIDPEVMTQLMAYHWPGNVREISTVIEQMVLFAQNRFTLDLLPGQIAQNEIRLDPQMRSLNQTAEQVEAGIIEQALKKVGGNKSDCARILGISRPTLYYKLEKYQITYNDQIERGKS